MNYSPGKQPRLFENLNKKPNTELLQVINYGS